MPSLDVSEASPVSWMFDAVAELHAQSNLAYDKANNWDVTQKTGVELDNFVKTFGFQRRPGTHSTGTVTLFFGAPTTRPYLVPQGTELYTQRPNGSRLIFRVSSEQGIAQYSSFATLPIIAEEMGGSHNIRSSEIQQINMEIEQLISVRNEDPTRGGRGEERDGELQERFRMDLFRDILGNEAWYRQIATRHPQVSSVQLLRPTQEAEEHLKIQGGEVVCTEDSLKYTYPNIFSVYVPRTNQWLIQDQDFIVTLNNEASIAPRVKFIGVSTQEGDSVIVRYQYCSIKSRNNPVANDMRYLDLFVTGNSPEPIVDFATWTSGNIVGVRNVTPTTHPGSTAGRPYYVYVRQPVYEIPEEIDVRGRRYVRGRDFSLVKDDTLNRNSAKARDILQWNSTLPENRFPLPYFHDMVVSDIQSVVNEPDMHTAIDDVLIHAADRIEFNFEVTVEWERGIGDQEGLRVSIAEFLSEIQMGSKIRYGDIMKMLNDVNRVDAVFLDNITSSTTIRGRNSWKTDIPLPDGVIPTLGNLTVNTTAPNLY